MLGIIQNLYQKGKVNAMTDKKGRNFFYNKNGGRTPRKNCFWVQRGNKKYLVSYQTVVCSVDDRGKFEKYWNDYSSTTQNQINQFIGLFDKDFVIRSDTGEIINGINKKEWLEMETSDLDYYDYMKIKELLPQIEWGIYGFGGFDYARKITY